MPIKVSDIIAIPYLEGIFILNESNYSNNFIDKFEVIDNLSTMPSVCSLFIIDFNLKIENENEFVNFIKLCNENLVSGVLISEHLFSGMKVFKSFMKNFYRSINTPIIIIPNNISFFNVTYYIQDFISEHYKSEHNKILEINNKFSYISLKNPDIRLMIDYFKTIINNPIIIYDEFFNVIVSTDDHLNEYDKIPGTVEKDFLKNLYFYKQNITFKNANLPDKEYVRVLFPITFEKRDKAFLAVFEINTPLTNMDYTILEICATSTLIEMKRLMAIKKIEEKHINDFLYDLIYRTDNKIDEIKRRAEVLNITEDSYYSSIIFDIHFKDTYKTYKGNSFEENKDIILNSIISFIDNSNKQSIVSRFGKSILILHKVVSNSTKSYEEIKEMCSNLQNYLINKYDYIYIHVGIGSIIDNLKNVSKSYHEALSSVSYGRSVYDETATFIISYNDSSLLKIFNKVKDNDLLNEIIPENLKNLKKYDAECKSDLIKTLTIYLDCNCNAKKASEKMYIHYKTMLYRLEKIIKDFNIDLENSNSRLQVELGLQIINILDIHTQSD